MEIVPATSDRLEDVLTILGRDPRACLCQYWRMSSGDYARSRGTGRMDALRAEMDQTPPPGMIAYLDGEPVGWVGFGVRQRMERLVRSRTIPQVDESPVWSVFCFTVRVGFRRQGVARALLDGLIEYAQKQGVPALEAYPVETEGDRIHGTAAYVGVTSMFEAAGFRRILETGARSDHRPRWLMRLGLNN